MSKSLLWMSRPRLWTSQITQKRRRKEWQIFLMSPALLTWVSVSVLCPGFPFWGQLYAPWLFYAPLLHYAPLSLSYNASTSTSPATCPFLPFPSVPVILIRITNIKAVIPPPTLVYVFTLNTRVGFPEPSIWWFGKNVFGGSIVHSGAIWTIGHLIFSLAFSAPVQLLRDKLWSANRTTGGPHFEI